MMSAFFFPCNLRGGIGQNEWIPFARERMKLQQW